MADKFFLVTTPLKEFWGRNCQTLFLGEWCLRYDRRQDWQNLSYKILDYPWNDRKSVYQASEYCFNIYKRLLPLICERLNIIHNKEYSNRYWQIIIGPWLHHYIEILYDRYTCLQSATKSYDIETIGLKEECFITPVDYAHFKHLCTHNDLYNLQLYTELLILMGYNSPKKGINLAPSPYEGEKRKTVKDYLKHLTKELFFRIERVVGYRHPVIMCDMYLSRSIIWKIISESNYKIWHIKSIRLPDVSKLKKNMIIRKSLVDMDSFKPADSFHEILMKTLSSNFPLVYLEGYEVIRKKVLHYWNKSPRVLISSVGWFNNEAFKFLSAEMSERGTKLFVLQHGGSYGLKGWNSINERHETSISDKFYSWGWQEIGNEKIKPMPNPKISSLRSLGDTGRYANNNGRILYVSNIFPRYHYFFESFPIGPQYLRYLDWHYRFLENLTEEVRKLILIRLWSVNVDYGWNTYQRLKERLPDIEIDDHSISYLKRLEDSRMVVCDNKLTTYLEALARNIPCIFFWDKRFWEIRKEYISYFEYLYKMEILFDSPEKAAKKVVEIYDEPLKWWFSDGVQDARKQFVDKFAIGTNDWKEVWVKELLRDYINKENKKHFV